nr:hypothetical protein [Bacillus pumilus]
MKVKISLLLVATLLMVLAACGNQQGKPSSIKCEAYWRYAHR